MRAIHQEITHIDSLTNHSYFVPFSSTFDRRAHLDWIRVERPLFLRVFDCGIFVEMLYSFVPSFLPRASAMCDFIQIVMTNQSAFSPLSSLDFFCLDCFPQVFVSARDSFSSCVSAEWMAVPRKCNFFFDFPIFLGSPLLWTSEIDRVTFGSDPSRRKASGKRRRSVSCFFR